MYTTTISGANSLLTPISKRPRCGPKGLQWGKHEQEQAPGLRAFSTVFAELGLVPVRCLLILMKVTDLKLRIGKLCGIQGFASVLNNNNVH